MVTSFVTAGGSVGQFQFSIHYFFYGFGNLPHRCIATGRIEYLTADFLRSYGKQVDNKISDIFDMNLRTLLFTTPYREFPIADCISRESVGAQVETHPRRPAADRATS